MNSAGWSTEWTDFSDEYTHFCLTRVLIDHGFDSLLCKDILFMVTFDKNVSYVRVLDFAFCNLNFGATFILKASNRLALLSNDQPNSVVRNRNDISS